MNDIEKMRTCLEYIRDSKKVERDIIEFAQTLSGIINLFEDEKTLRSMPPEDIILFLVSCKHFSEEIKPLIIKYQILPYITKDD